MASVFDCPQLDLRRVVGKLVDYPKVSGMDGIEVFQNWVFEWVTEPRISANLLDYFAHFPLDRVLELTVTLLASLRKEDLVHYRLVSTFSQGTNLFASESSLLLSIS